MLMMMAQAIFSDQWMMGTGCAKAKGHSLDAAMMMVLVIVASMMRLFEGECFYASLIRISHRRTERKERGNVVNPKLQHILLRAASYREAQ